VIEGPGHIHVHSTQPQKIQYVRLQTMGVTKPSQGMEGATSGRYALHLHFSGDGTRGSIIRGVACVDWRSRCFVPHASHGVTMIDNVAVNGWAEGFWWDPFDETDDLLVDALVVAGVNMPREYIGATPRFDAIALPAGRNTVIRNSVATGACCDKLSNGFDWPPNILDDRGSDDVTWEFNGGNVAHNNTGNGIRFWTNGRDVHVTGEYFGYRNATGRGIEAGAYRNGIQFHDITLVDDVALQAASPKLNTDREPPRWMRCDLTGPAGQPALVIGHRQQVPEEGVYTEFVDCTLSGTPKVLVENTGHPARLRFIRSNLTPQDVVIESGSGNEGLHIVIQNADGTGWEIRKVNGVVSVVQR
jgi:hypothetical protein